MIPPENNLAALTANIILTRLQERVSKGNAKLLLDTVRVQCGVNLENSVEMDKEQAKTLCLGLIKAGGPAFQVGQILYKEYLM